MVLKFLIRKIVILLSNRIILKSNIPDFFQRKEQTVSCINSRKNLQSVLLTQFCRCWLNLQHRNFCRTIAIYSVNLCFDDSFFKLFFNFVKRIGHFYCMFCLACFKYCRQAERSIRWVISLTAFAKGQFILGNSSLSRSDKAFRIQRALWAFNFVTQYTWNTGKTMQIFI